MPVVEVLSIIPLGNIFSDRSVHRNPFSKNVVRSDTAPITISDNPAFVPVNVETVAGCSHWPTFPAEAVKKPSVSDRSSTASDTHCRPPREKYISHRKKSDGGSLANDGSLASEFRDALRRYLTVNSERTARTIGKSLQRMANLLGMRNFAMPIRCEK